MSAYNLTHYNKTPLVTVQNGQIDTLATSLNLIGPNTPSSGIYLNENFIYLLENFANTFSPSNPVIGQLWYDTVNDSLQVFKTSGIWQIIEPPFDGASGTATVSIGPNNTDVTVIISEDSIIGVASAIAISPNNLPTQIVIDDTAYNFATAFPQGICEGLTLGYYLLVNNDLTVSGNLIVNGGNGIVINNSAGITFNDGTTQSSAGSANISVNGQTVLPNGLVWQWGNAQVTTSQPTIINFNSNFQNQVLNVQLTNIGNGNVAVGLKAVAKGLFQFIKTSAWFLVGGSVIFIILRFASMANPVAASIFGVLENIASWGIHVISTLFPKALSLAGTVSKNVYNDSQVLLKKIVDNIQNLKQLQTKLGHNLTLEELFTELSASLSPSEKTVVDNLKKELGY